MRTRMQNMPYLRNFTSIFLTELSSPNRHASVCDQLYYSAKKARCHGPGLYLQCGSPCATLFITVLVLRLLTENRCDSMSYQRACGPRQAGNPDKPIFPLTLPKEVSQVESCVCRKLCRKIVASSAGLLHPVHELVGRPL